MKVKISTVISIQRLSNEFEISYENINNVITDKYFFHPRIISTFSIFVIEILKMIAMATKRDKRLY